MDMGTPQVDSRDVHELFTGALLRGHLLVINTVRNKQSQTKKVNTTLNYDEQWRNVRYRRPPAGPPRPRLAPPLGPTGS